MTARYKITQAAELESLERMRDFIADACTKHGIHEDITFGLQLAVDEAATNVIQHGYATMDPGSIILELLVSDEKIIVKVTDFGHPFEPSQAETPDIHAALEDRDLGGFGLFFIYTMMDAVNYVTDEDGNCLILTKHIEP